MKILGLFKKIFIPCAENNYFPLFLKGKFLNLYLILLLILKIFTIPLIFSISKSIFFADITKTALIDFLNSERKSRGLPLLSENPILDQSAYLKAKDILEKDYFSHWSPEGTSPWYWFKAAGYDYQFAGENLAIGFLDSKEVHEALMSSPSHRQNILNPNYKEIGIAVLKGEFNGNEVYVVVQHFGSPKFVPAESKEKLTQKPTPTTISTPTETQIKTQPSTPTEIASLEAATPTRETSTSVLTEQKEIPLPQKITFNLVKFLALKYNSVLNGIIYFTLAILIFSLTLTIYCDFFIYRKFVIDYKELIPRWASFCLILIFFLYLDQSKLIQIIPHQLIIHGF
jgi:hypothetical protein